MSNSLLLGLLVLVLLPVFCSASTQCPTGNTTDNDITKILTLVNNRRSMIANGQQQNGNATDKLPMAKSIMELSYNCTLEEQAAALTDGSCNYTAATPPAGTSMIQFGEYDYYAAGGDVISTILTSLLGTIEHESLTAGTTSVTYSAATGPNLLDYANLVRAAATSIGCTTEKCASSGTDYTAVICLTDQPPLTDGGVVYEVATTVCDCPAGSTCDPALNLCIPASASSSTSPASSSPSSSTSAAGSSTTSPGAAGGGAAFPVPGAGENTICSNNTELTDSLRTQFLDTHNVRRSQLALGNIKDAGPSRTLALPTASNMYQLVWDCGLEAEAANHVRTCPNASASATNATAQNGENFYSVAMTSLLPYYRDAVKKAVTEWWKVYRFYEVPGTALTYTAAHSAVSSYTQMGWAATRRLGCSIGNCSGTYKIDCRYAIKGNTIGSQQYSSGATCSACPAGSACSAALGLCV